MVYFRDRHAAYKVAFGGLVLSIIGYVMGYACPYWAILKLQQYGYVDQTIGLWQACIHGSMTCVSNLHGNNPDWINASRGLTTICLLMLFLVLFIGCYRNMTRYGQANCNSTGRHVEVIAVLAVLIGSIGVIVFAAEFHRIYVFHYNVGHLYWAFGVACGSLALAGVSFVVMFAFNSPKPSRPRGIAALRVRGQNGHTVALQIPTDPEDGRLHIPYFGDISADQLVMGAGPVMPPSYDFVVSGVNYPNPPLDGSEAPPLYEEITKEGGPPSTPPEVRNSAVKEEEKENANDAEQV